MSNIKKAYTAIVELLQANQESTVGDILPQVIELAAAKQGGGGSRASTFHRDDEGNVVGIQCYYHKLWMNPNDVEFGAKASSASGFNSMCKDGVSKWNKQQSAFKKAQQELLGRVAEGEIAPEDIAGHIADLEEARDAITPREDGYGFDSLEALLESL